VNVTAGQSSSGPWADLTVNRELLDAMARLPAEQRAVIRRSYYDAWTVAQIADDLHVDQQTVTASLHYGVRALLLSLEERGVSHQRGTAPRPRSSPPSTGQRPDDSDCQDNTLQDQR